jgi:hypothetical protein
VKLLLLVLLLAQLTELVAQENVEISEHAEVPESAAVILSLLMGGLFIYLGFNAIKRKGLPVGISFYPAPARTTEQPSDHNREAPIPQTPKSGFFAYFWVFFGVVLLVLGGILCGLAIIRFAL